MDTATVPFLYCIALYDNYIGCTKLRNEIETQRTKRTKTKRNITKRSEIYYNAKQNEMNTTKRNETKYTKVRKAIERNGI